MVDRVCATEAEGASGDLSLRGENVEAVPDLGIDSATSKRRLNDREVADAIHAVPPRHDGKNDVALIVKNGTAASHSSKKKHVFAVGFGEIHLPPRILMLAKDHASVVPVGAEENRLFSGRIKEELLD